MTNLEKYNEAFKETFMIEDDALGKTLAYQSVEAWDSVGHMSLITELEAAFDFMMETEDVIDFSDYEGGKKILAKYGVII